MHNDHELLRVAVNRLRELADISVTDPEKAHSQADQLLCDFISVLGYPLVAEEFQKIKRWYS